MHICFLLYMKLIQCSGVAYIYGGLEEGVGISLPLGICAFFYMQNFFSVVVLHSDLCLIGGGGYVCLL